MAMENLSVLDSHFTIDGVAMDSTPSEILDECSLAPAPERQSAPEIIVDETVDVDLVPLQFDRDKISDYVSAIQTSPASFPLLYPTFGTMQAITATLTDVIWKEGHFKLSNINLSLFWKWNGKRLGNMAAFYQSVCASSGIIWDLGVKLKDYDYQGSDNCSMSCVAGVDKVNGITEMEDMSDADEEIFLTEKRRCPARAIADPESWIIYVPFDVCSMRLGSSAFSLIAGNGGDSAPKCTDPDYFRDCFELVREFVEDGVARSGIGVGRGGLMCAASMLCGGTGLKMELRPLSEAYAEDTMERLLFSEIPGVLLQISDSDYDYIDSQFLLQDVAYYPLGHPVGGKGCMGVSCSKKHSVTGILESLLGSRDMSEGED